MACTTKPAIGMINPKEFDDAVCKMREFFKSKGFIEVHTQCRLSIFSGM